MKAFAFLKHIKRYITPIVQTGKDLDKVANGAIDVMVYWHVGLNNYVIKKV
ncbi:hypothetical protein [Viridibacillus arvi]|uniref:hypothetical protein n=1 Tax=Viridibacillus arvi TaxID=263475 RepID=UPI003D2868B3